MLTEAGKIALTKEIKSSKKLLKELKTLENEWDVLSKHCNKIPAAFWKIDKRIDTIYKKLRNMKISSYPIRSQDDLLGYIEHMEIQVEEYSSNRKSTHKEESQ